MPPNLKIGFEHCLSLPFKDYRHFPDHPAVYIAYVAPNIVLYVGRTTSLRNRSKEHRSSLIKIKDLRIAWFPLPLNYHKDTEKQLIKTLSPVLNHHWKPKGSHWIHPGWTRDIHKFIKQELNALQQSNGNGHK